MTRAREIHEAALVLDARTDTLRRVLMDGVDLVERSADQEARPPDANPRQRFYRITASGREALSQEANRLQALVESATRALGIS